MPYKYELHCHSSEVSRCSHIDGKTLAEEYIKAGYDGIVLTNHMSRFTYMDLPDMPWNQMVDFYLDGYHLVKEAAGDRLTVLLGMEICFHENFSDFLVYGLDEAFLYEHGNLMELGIQRFSKLAHEHGLLVFQAHPFRNRMTIADPNLLDGVEVHNGNPRHDSRNDVARLWAEKFHLLMSSGSDYHEYGDIDRGGMLTERPIRTNTDLVQALQGEHTLIER